MNNYRIMLFVSLLCSLLWSNAIVEITQPDEGEKFCSGDPITLNIKVLPQFDIFGDNDNGRYYFSLRYGNPNYGEDCRNGGKRNHSGVDILFSDDPGPNGLENRPIHAPMCGIVEQIDTFYPHITYNDDGTVHQCRGNYGLTLRVFYPEIDKTVFYAHLDNVLVSPGNWICPPQQIATGGNSGRCETNGSSSEYNYHLHIETADGEQLSWDSFIENRINPFDMLYAGALDSLALFVLNDDTVYEEISYSIVCHEFVLDPAVDCEMPILDSFETEITVPGLSPPPFENCDYFTGKAFVFGKKSSQCPCIDWQTYYNDFTFWNILGQYFGETEPTPPEEQAGIEGSDEINFEVCKPRLVILPTFSTVDVRVMDIYDYPADDPCEKTSAPIAALGFGTRGNWSAVSHTIRQRWPEPFKCYYAEGIIIGTPGYAVGC